MNKKRLVGIAIALTSLVGVVGCGVGGASANTASAKTSAPFTIGYSAWPGYYFWNLDQAEGFFKKEGVNVKLVFFPVYSNSVSALEAGRLDANSQTLSDTMAPLANGVKEKIALIIDNSAGADALVAKPSIKSLKDLKGKSIATEFGTVDDFFMLEALKKAGLTIKDVNYSNMDIASAGSAFIAGKLDAAVLWQPFLSKAISQGKGHVLYSSANTPGLIADVVAFSQKTMETRPADVMKVERAWFDGINFYEHHPNTADKIMAKAAGVTPSAFKTMMGGVKIFTLADNLKSFQKGNSFVSLQYTAQQTAKFLKKENMLPEIPSFTGVFDDSNVQTIAKDSKN